MAKRNIAITSSYMQPVTNVSRKDDARNSQSRGNPRFDSKALASKARKSGPLGR